MADEGTYRADMLHEVVKINQEVKSLEERANAADSKAARLKWELKDLGMQGALGQTQAEIAEIKVELGRINVESADLHDMVNGIKESQEKAWEELEDMKLEVGELVEAGGSRNSNSDKAGGEDMMMIQGVVGLLGERAKLGVRTLKLANLDGGHS